MQKTIAKKNKLTRRHSRIRSRVAGTASRPRLAVSKSNRYIFAQVINDETGTTLAALSSRNLTEAKGKPMTEAAALVGRTLAQKVKAQGIEQVVFDRGGFIYTGIVRAVADSAREGGLAF